MVLVQYGLTLRLQTVGWSPAFLPFRIEQKPTQAVYVFIGQSLT